MTAAHAFVLNAILMCALVVLMVWWAFRTERRARCELTWPTVEGLVTRSEVIAGKTLKPRVAYRYSFDGREYVGTVIQSNMVLYSGAKAPQLLCERFPVGSRPIVHVDADNPKRSVLIPGGDRAFLYFVLALAAFFLLTSGLMAVMPVVTAEKRVMPVS